MPLTMVDAGRDYIVRKVNGRDTVLKHLETLGIVPGAMVKVISKNASGVIINIKESRVAIGLDLANKVLV
ncbi:ferrous iron transport protein A [bacterium]|nr:ferrous iron transport protein A [bacterium]